MNFNDLECFLEVARHRHVTAAAKVMRLAQSTVSVRIQRLEEFLGTPLFDRARERRFELTKPGKRLLVSVNRFVNVAEDIRANSQAERQRPPPVRIGVNESVAHTWLGGWLTRLRRELPDLALELKVGTSDELDEMMVDGELDVALGTRGFGYRAIERRQLAELPMVFVGDAERHDGREYALSELASEGLITFQKRSTPQLALEELLQAERLANCRVDCVSSVAIMLHLVEEGAGVATLPQALVDAAPRERLRVLRCRAKLPSLPLWLSYRRHARLANLLAYLDRTPPFTDPPRPKVRGRKGKSAGPRR